MRLFEDEDKDNFRQKPSLLISFYVITTLQENTL